MLLPLQGALLRISATQGDALGYALVAPLGRIVHNYCASYFFSYYLHYSMCIHNYELCIMNYELFKALLRF